MRAGEGGPYLGYCKAVGIQRFSATEWALYKFPGIKVVVLVLEHFKIQCLGKLVLIAAENTMVVSYLYKVGECCYSDAAQNNQKLL